MIIYYMVLVYYDKLINYQIKELINYIFILYDIL